MQNIGRKRVYSMDMTYIEQRQMIVSIDNLSELIANSETTAILERTEEARNRRSSSRNTLDNRLIDLYGRGSVSSKSNISR
jgi:hypothetical protein